MDARKLFSEQEQSVARWATVHPKEWAIVCGLDQRHITSDRFDGIWRSLHSHGLESVAYVLFWRFASQEGILKEAMYPKTPLRTFLYNLKFTLRPPEPKKLRVNLRDGTVLFALKTVGANPGITLLRQLEDGTVSRLMHVGLETDGEGQEQLIFDYRD